MKVAVINFVGLQNLEHAVDKNYPLFQTLMWKFADEESYTISAFFKI